MGVYDIQTEDNKKLTLEEFTTGILLIYTCYTCFLFSAGVLSLLYFGYFLNGGI